MLINFGFRVWSRPTQGRPAGGREDARLSPAPAEHRGSTGHAWSAGFDWAAVVVVTGRRHGCGPTVPGAARSPIPPCPLPFPGFPRWQEPGAHRSPHGLRPGKDELGSDSPEPVPRLRVQVRAVPTPGGKWRQVSAAGSRTPSSAPLAPGSRASPCNTGASRPGPAPGRSSPRLGVGGQALQSHGPQNSRRVSVELLRQNHLGGFLKSARARPAAHRCLAGGAWGSAFQRAAPGGFSRALDSGKREPRVWRAVRRKRAPRASLRDCPRALVRGVLPADPPRLWPCPGRTPLGRRNSVRPRPPEFEVCTCFQNLVTFFLRRILFWSVTLRAIKLQ